MRNSLILGILWVGLALYAFVFAPPDQPDTLELITKLSGGQWDGINPVIISLFNLMGVWPIIYTSLMLIDGRGQKIPAWPFASLSFAVGAFAILPYLIFREPGASFTGEKNWVLKLWDSRFVGLITFLGGLALILYGIFRGDWADFLTQWQTSRFINVMSLDFCALTLLVPILIKDDMEKRGLKNPLLLWIVSLIPVLGPASYIIIRPSLISTKPSSP
ncbi:MAG: hypothetical protein N5P05_000723 [Chroococcopsis gigantea SAG 12.99]|jgi:hypothetical protein|nr:DUF2834 domain-containing protein [Chlorogloea purpurea SAG 13.99]MDV2999117.1 hypothetical protein [Chroococcopsis gigantea SAG 12.99]